MAAREATACSAPNPISLGQEIQARLVASTFSIKTPSASKRSIACTGLQRDIGLRTQNENRFLARRAGNNPFAIALQTNLLA